jgi:hypothetical protein
MILPNALYTGHLNANANTSRGLSPQLWQRASKCMLPPNGDPGFYFADDFLNQSGIGLVAGAAVALPTVTGITMGGYSAYVDIGGSALRVADYTGGALRLTVDATDDDLAIIGTGDLLEISRTAGERAVTIFECRVKYPTVTDGSTFIGLATTEVIADGGLIAGTGELINATGGGIGFRTLEADPDELDFVYKNAAQTTVEVKDGAQALTLDTWYKLGFVYDPAAENAKKIAYYINGVKQTTYVTDTNMAAATFPDSDHLALVAALAGSAVAKSFDIDWWAVYQGSVDS